MSSECLDWLPCQIVSFLFPPALLSARYFRVSSPSTSADLHGDSEIKRIYYDQIASEAGISQVRRRESNLLFTCGLLVI